MIDLRVTDIPEMLGVRRYMLYHAWLAALDFVYAVVVVRGAGIDILGFVYRSRQVCLSGLLCEIWS